jgi:hypothetical protein
MALESSGKLMTPLGVVMGVIAALLAKAGNEFLLTVPFDRPLWHCSEFVDNRHCSFDEWLTNSSDVVVVMLPAFLLVMFLTSLFVHKKK